MSNDSFDVMFKSVVQNLIKDFHFWTIGNPKNYWFSLNYFIQRQDDGSWPKKQRQDNGFQDKKKEVHIFSLILFFIFNFSSLYINIYNRDKY